MSVVTKSILLNLSKTASFFNPVRRLTVNKLQPLNKMSSNFGVVETGKEHSLNYKMFFKNKDGDIISPIHDIPLYADKEASIFNMVVEIPRWTNAKMEMNVKMPMNPIVQDVKDKKPRYVANVFPHHGYIWNYGAFPQTWEDPEHIDKDTKAGGDNDPIDVLEIGSRVAKRGDVIQVKVLGILALIDDDETDWKVLAIDVNDKVADKMSDVKDIEKYFPGLLKASVEWLVNYKIPSGKPPNKFAFDGEAKNAEFALKIVKETNKFWESLMDKPRGPMSCLNLTQTQCSKRVDPKESEKIIKEEDKFEPVKEMENLNEINTWHFLK